METSEDSNQSSSEDSNQSSSEDSNQSSEGDEISMFDIIDYDEIIKCPKCSVIMQNCSCNSSSKELTFWEIINLGINPNEYPSASAKKLKKLSKKIIKYQSDLEKQIEKKLPVTDSKYQLDLKKKNEEKFSYNNYCTFRESFVQLDKGNVDRYLESQEQNKLSAKNAGLKRSLEVCSDRSSRKITRKSNYNLRIKDASDSSNSNSIIYQNKEIKTPEESTNDFYSKNGLQSDCNSFKNVEILKNDVGSSKKSNLLPEEDEQNQRKMNQSGKYNSDAIEKKERKAIENKRSSTNLNDGNSRKKRKLENVDEDNTFYLKEKQQNVRNMKFVSDDTQIDENKDSAFNTLDLFVSDLGDDGTLSNLQTVALQNESKVHESIKENGSSNIHYFSDGFVIPVQSSPMALVDQEDAFQKDSKTSHNEAENKKCKDRESFTITFDNHLDGNKQKERQSDYSHAHLSKKNNTSEKFSRSDCNTFDSENATLSVLKEPPVEAKKADIRDLLYDVCATFENMDVNKKVTSNSSHNRIYEKRLSKKSDMKSSNATTKSESMHSKIKTDSGLMKKSLEDNHDANKFRSEKQLLETSGSITLDTTVNEKQVSQIEHSESKTDNSECATKSLSVHPCDNTFINKKQLSKTSSTMTLDTSVNENKVSENEHSESKIDNSEFTSKSLSDNHDDSTFVNEKQLLQTSSIMTLDISVSENQVSQNEHSESKIDNSEFTSKSLSDNHDNSTFVSEKQLFETSSVMRLDTSMNEKQVCQKVHSEKKTDNSDLITSSPRNNFDSKPESDKQVFKIPDSGITNILMHSETEHSERVNLKLFTSPSKDNLGSTFAIKKQGHRIPNAGASDISMNKKPIVESDHCYTKTHNSQFISRSLTENADRIFVNEKEHSKMQDAGKSDQTNQRQTREKVRSKCETNNSESFSNCFKSNSAPNLFLFSRSRIECDPEILNEYRKEINEKVERMKKDLLLNGEGETKTLKEHLHSCNLGMPSISQHKKLQTKETEDSIMLRDAPKIKYQQKFSNQIANNKKSGDAKNGEPDGEPDFPDFPRIAKTLKDFNLDDDSKEASSSTGLEQSKIEEYNVCNANALYSDDYWARIYSHLVSGDEVTNTEYKPIFSQTIVPKDMWEWENIDLEIPRP